jgi:hypothetical protein
LLQAAAPDIFAYERVLIYFNRSTRWNWHGHPPFSMRISQRLWKTLKVGGIIWFVSQLGFYICLFAGGALGALPYNFFCVLAFWPFGIVSLCFPDGFSDALQWPLLNIISLVGWLLLAVIATSLFHLFRVVGNRVSR